MRAPGAFRTPTPGASSSMGEPLKVSTKRARDESCFYLLMSGAAWRSQQPGAPLGPEPGEGPSLLDPQPLVRGLLVAEFSRPGVRKTQSLPGHCVPLESARTTGGRGQQGLCPHHTWHHPEHPDSGRHETTRARGRRSWVVAVEDSDRFLGAMSSHRGAPYPWKSTNTSGIGTSGSGRGEMDRNMGLIWKALWQCQAGPLEL